MGKTTELISYQKFLHFELPFCGSPPRAHRINTYVDQKICFTKAIVEQTFCSSKYLFTNNFYTLFWTNNHFDPKILRTKIFGPNFHQPNYFDHIIDLMDFNIFENNLSFFSDILYFVQDGLGPSTPTK